MFLTRIIFSEKNVLLFCQQEYLDTHVYTKDMKINLAASYFCIDVKVL